VLSRFKTELGVREMESENRYRLSLFGEFGDKSLEDEFWEDSLGRSAHWTAYIALFCGALLALFLANSYFTEGNTGLFMKITPIRLVFIFLSIAVSFTARRITKHKHLVYLVTFFQISMVVTYLLTLRQYQSLNYFSILGLLVITMALFLLPNRLVLSQLVAIAFSLAFFLGPSRKLAGLQANELYRIVAYQTILLLYGSINFWWTEVNKRRAFKARKELAELSVQDTLTGVFNRKKFDDALDEWLNFSERYNNPLTLILFDIDDFKGINDNFGHIAGDGVLQEAARAVSAVIRKADVFARWGGDEFALLLPNTDLAAAEGLAERIRAAIGSLALDVPKKISCSFGVAAYEKGDTKQLLLRRADEMLLRAKSGGKDRVVS